MSEKTQATIVAPVGMGWLPDYPSIRDYTVEEATVQPMLAQLNTAVTPRSLPAAVDLRPWCSPIENQGALGSCTANAAVGMVEYYERRAYGKHLDASRLFLYKATRDLLKWQGDTGAFLRTTMQAMVLFGVPPETYWPYTDKSPDFDIEPAAFHYSFGQSYKALTYYRLDPPGTAAAALLDQIKTKLSAGLPSMFGFTVYQSYTQAGSSGKIPYPTASEKVVGGHAMVAVGYDNNMKIKNTNPGAVETTGALLIRNSWGTGWGAAGYGWLPYAYVGNGLATDWWLLISQGWVDTGNFG